VLKRITVLMIIATLSLGSFRYVFADETTDSSETETTVNGQVGPGAISENGAAGASSTGAGNAAGATSSSGSVLNTVTGAITDAVTGLVEVAEGSGPAGKHFYVKCECNTWIGFFNPLCKLTCTMSITILEGLSWLWDYSQNVFE
jgi:hypothetical protein